MSTPVATEVFACCHSYRTECGSPCPIDETGCPVVAGMHALTTPAPLGACLHTHLAGHDVLRPTMATVLDALLDCG